MTPVVRCKLKHAHGSLMAAAACDKEPKAPRAIVIYVVWAGNGGSYDASATYDVLEEMIADVRAAILAGRHVLIEPDTTTRQAFEKEGEPFPDGHNPLLEPNL